MRVFFDRELDTVATFWRIYRRDGVAIGFTSHDRDLVFGGLRHLAAPGMIPAAIRLTAELSNDSAEVQGALNHTSIRETELAAGLFDEAAIEIGAVDWTSLSTTRSTPARSGGSRTTGRSSRPSCGPARACSNRTLYRAPARLAVPGFAGKGAAFRPCASPRFTR